MYEEITKLQARLTRYARKTRLDSACRGAMMLPGATGAGLAATTAAAAGEAVDDDAEEGGDGVDEAAEDAGNAVDDCHDTGADGAEHALDLRRMLEYIRLSEVEVVVRKTYARNDGSHFEGLVVICLSGLVCVYVVSIKRYCSLI